VQCLLMLNNSHNLLLDIQLVFDLDVISLLFNN
jgi:hypothetical protein